MKFLILTILVIFSLSANAYKVRKEPFTPSVGVIAPVAQDDILTDNYKEMINNPSKKLISMGLPEHIDLDDNIVVGDSYEDVEYVKSNRKGKAGKSRFAKKQEDEEEEVDERDLDDLLDVEFAEDVSTGQEAYDAVMRHQEQILAFLEEVAEEKEPSDHQLLVVKQLFKYVKLVQQAHDILKSQESPDDVKFIAQIAASIHQYTMLLDQHKYTQERNYSTQRNLIGKSQLDNENVLEKLRDNVDRIVALLDDDEDGQFDQLVATEVAEDNAQRAVKVLQTRSLIDKVKHAHVEKNREPQLELLENYKVVLKEEKKQLNRFQDALDELDELFALNDELTEDQIQILADSEILPEKSRVAARAVLQSLEQEDEYQAEVSLELIRNNIRELIDDGARTDGKLAQQMITMLSLTDAIMEGDMHEFEELCNGIIDEVSEKQELFVGNEDITHLALVVKKSIRQSNYKMVAAQANKLYQFVAGKAYPKPSNAKLDNSLSDAEKVDRNAGAEVRVLGELTKAAKDLVLAEDRQQAEDFIEQVAQLTQQMVKVAKFRNAVSASLKEDADLDFALEGLDTLLETEHDNLRTDKEQMETSRESVEGLAQSTLTEEWEDSHLKAITIVEEENLNALARWSVTTAAQYIQLDVDYEVKVHLAKALKYIDADLAALDHSLESVEHQQELLEKALSAAKSGNIIKVTESLELLILEIQTEQAVVEVDVDVEADAENAMALLADGAIEEAVDAVTQISLKIVDPRGEDQDDIFKRLEEQGEGNGVDPDVALDIKETNKAPTEVAVENLVEEIEVYRQQVETNVEEEDKLAAQESFEALFQFAQKQYKQLDFDKTLNAIKKAEEVGADNESYIQTLEDFKQSNVEESEALKKYASDILGLKEDVQSLEASFEESDNTEIIAEIRELYNNEFATAGVKVQLDNAIDFLELNKRSSALEAIETVAQRLEESIDNANESIESIEQQNDLVDEALEAAEDNDFETILEYMDKLEESIQEGQKLVLTDDRLVDLLEAAIQQLSEGQFDEVLTSAEEIAQSLTNEVNAQREQDIADPTAAPSEETQEAAAEELEQDVENAEDGVENGTELEALEAIEHVELQTQIDAKQKLVQETKDVVEEALDNSDEEAAIEATESLIEMIEAEKSTLNEDLEEVDEVADQLDEAVNGSDDSDEDAEDVEEEAEELLEEAEEVDAVPAEVEAAIEEAQEAADEGNQGDAEEKLEEALDDLEEEKSDIQKSDDIIEQQVEQLKEAIQSIQDGDKEAALLSLNNVFNSVDDQPNVKISEEAEEKAEEAKEAVAEGNQDEAAELIEEIVEAAEEEIEEDLEDAGIELEDEQEDTEEEEEQQDEELIDLIEGVIKVLTPEDPAELSQDECLEAVAALNNYEGASQFEIQIAQIKISIESDDYDGAAAQAEALLTFVNPSESDLEEDDGLTKNLLPELEARFQKTVKRTRAMKKAEKRISKNQIKAQKIVKQLKKLVKSVRKH